MARGRPADEMQVRFEFFKILYRLNYLGFYFVYYHCNAATVLELHFIWLLPGKDYFKVCYKCKKLVAVFSGQSLLLGTRVPNDNSITCNA